MMQTRLYPSRPIVGQDLSKEPIIVVPNQSMSLKDILKKFMRRESLPVEKQAFYAENLGDLEKLAKADITVQLERAADLKQKIARGEKAFEEKNAAEKEAADKLAADLAEFNAAKQKQTAEGGPKV